MSIVALAVAETCGNQKLLCWTLVYVDLEEFPTKKVCVILMYSETGQAHIFEYQDQVGC